MTEDRNGDTADRVADGVATLAADAWVHASGVWGMFADVIDAAEGARVFADAIAADVAEWEWEWADTADAARNYLVTGDRYGALITWGDGSTVAVHAWPDGYASGVFAVDYEEWPAEALAEWGAHRREAVADALAYEAERAVRVSIDAHAGRASAADAAECVRRAAEAARSVAAVVDTCGGDAEDVADAIAEAWASAVDGYAFTAARMAAAVTA